MREALYMALQAKSAIQSKSWWFSDAFEARPEIVYRKTTLQNKLELSIYLELIYLSTYPFHS